MEINSPVEMLKAIELMVAQMDRAQRVKFLKWFKDRKKQYDLMYPMGMKLEEPKAEPTPSLLVPDNVAQPIIIPEGVNTEPPKLVID